MTTIYNETIRSSRSSASINYRGSTHLALAVVAVSTAAHVNMYRTVVCMLQLDNCIIVLYIH
jgi:hypothetical protein